MLGKVIGGIHYRFWVFIDDCLGLSFSGEFEVADGVSASVFNAILEFYQYGVIHCPPHVSVIELREACDYFMVPFTAQTVKCQNLRGLLHELSNDGAQEQFENYLEELILPEMVSTILR